MQAKVTQPFRGCRDGEKYPVQFQPGDTITGDLARAMVAAGYAERALGDAPSNKAMAAAPENKARSTRKKSNKSE